jgi:DNA-directed RNA polymerase subunit beta'
VAETLRAAVVTEGSQHRKKQMLKRLKIVDAFRNSGETARAATSPSG